MMDNHLQEGCPFPDLANGRRTYAAVVRQHNRAIPTAPISIPYHPAIEIDNYSITVKFKADFHASSEVCLVGVNGALPHQVDTTPLSILIAYADKATNLEIYLNFRNTRDESAGLKHSIFHFMKRLAECVKAFKNVECPYIAVKVDAEDVNSSYDQLRNLGHFYFLKTDWELWICFAKKKSTKETYVKQYIGGELDRRIQGQFTRLARVERKRKRVQNMAWR